MKRRREMGRQKGELECKRRRGRKKEYKERRRKDSQRGEIAYEGEPGWRRGEEKRGKRERLLERKVLWD